VQNNLIQILRRHYSNHLTLSYTGKVKKTRGNIAGKIHFHQKLAPTYSDYYAALKLHKHQNRSISSDWELLFRR